MRAVHDFQAEVGDVHQLPPLAAPGELAAQAPDDDVLRVVAVREVGRADDQVAVAAEHAILPALGNGAIDLPGRESARLTARDGVLSAVGGTEGEGRGPLCA